jgi:serine/threonine protein kinase/WD40 repeat protein
MERPEDETKTHIQAGNTTGDTRTGGRWYSRAAVGDLGASRVREEIDWTVGEVIDGRYDVRGLVGLGGMGAVYRVRHLEWNIDMVVKTPLAPLRSDPRWLEQFRREAQAWVDLGFHPHIVQCFYVRELCGALRIFAEYVGGGSLRDALHEGRIVPGRWDDIVDLAIQACDGLGFAHRKGLVHRDVKPANLLLTSDGRLTVTDFGLVQPRPDIEPRDYQRKIGDIPWNDHAGGTPHYAAPEQWSEPEIVDVRADLYALGVSLYEMCCGRRPFDNALEPEPAYVLAARHLGVAPPDPRTFSPTLPEPLAETILWCLQKRPRDRPADTNQLRTRLVELYEMDSVGGRPHERNAPDEGQLLAASLNNRALSLLDLGLEGQSLDLLRQALVTDPYHPEATFNFNMLRWRRGDVDDEDVLQGMTIVAAKNGQQSVAPLLRRVRLERGEAEELPPPSGPQESASDSNPTETTRELGSVRYEPVPVANGTVGEVLAVCPVSGCILVHNDVLGAVVASVNGSRAPVRLETEAIPWEASFSPTGRNVGFAEFLGKTFQVFDTQSGRLRSRHPLPEGSSLGGLRGNVLLLDDDKVLLVMNDARPAVLLYLPSTGRWTPYLVGHSRSISSMNVDVRQQTAVTSSRDGTVRTWHLDTGFASHVFRFGVSVVSARFADNDSRIVACCADGRVTVQDANRPEQDPLVAIRLRSEIPCAAAYSSSRDRLATWNVERDPNHAVATKRVQLWSVTSRRCVRSFRVCPKGGPDHFFVEIDEGDGILYAFAPGLAPFAWKLATSAARAQLSLCRPLGSSEILVEQNTVERLIAEAGERLESDPADAYRKLQEARSHENYRFDNRVLSMVRAIHGLAYRVALAHAWARAETNVRLDAVTALGFLDSGRIVSGHSSGYVCLWDWGLERRSCELSGLRDKVERIATRGSFLVATCGTELRVWNVEKARCIARFDLREGMADQVGVLADGSACLTIDADSRLRSWDLEIEELHWVAEVPPTFGLVREIRTEVGSGAFTVVSDSGGCLTFDRSPHPVTAPRVITANRGIEPRIRIDARLLVVEDAQERSVLAELRGHTAPVLVTATSPDARFVVSGDQSGTLRLWELDWDLEFRGCDR